jgi:antitoxin VapB
MGLNIKNENTCQLVSQLAEITGESMTGAITEAVRERLERVSRQRNAGLADHLLAIGKDCAPRLKKPFRKIDHGDLLYGKDGLPK